MSTDDKFWSNHLMVGANKLNRFKIVAQFPELKQSTSQNYLSLLKFLKAVPESYYSKEIFILFYGFLNNQENFSNSTPALLQGDARHDLSKAFHLLSEINKYSWHDSEIPIDDLALLKFCDIHLNPTYIKLIEGVYFPFVYIVASSLMIKDAKKVAGLELYNCMEVIKKSPYVALCAPYRAIVRNGIGHGGIKYYQDEIEYTDKKGNSETIDARSLFELVDSALDTCNGISAALRVFYLKNTEMGIKIPEQVMFEELQAQTESPVWKINGVLETESLAGRQINIYAETRRTDNYVVLYLAAYSAVLCEQLVSGYKSYCVSLSSPFAYPGTALFNGEKLVNCRKRNAQSLTHYDDVLKDMKFFFIPRPRMFKLPEKLATLLAAFRIQFEIYKNTLKNAFSRPTILVRESKIHQNGFRSVINSRVVFFSKDRRGLQSKIREFSRKIVKLAYREACQRNFEDKIVNYLPLGFAHVSVYDNNHRIRVLKNYGLAPDLVCTIEFKKISRIRTIDIANAKIETHGPFRIAWNRSWLEKTKGTDSENSGLLTCTGRLDERI